MGAYSLLLTQVPVRSLAPTWTPTPQGVAVPGKEFCVYQAGAHWTDCTVTIEAQVLANEAAWIVRGSPTDGIRFTLAADTGPSRAGGRAGPATAEPVRPNSFAPWLVKARASTLPVFRHFAEKAGGRCRGGARGGKPALEQRAGGGRNQPA